MPKSTLIQDMESIYERVKELEMKLSIILREDEVKIMKEDK